MNLDTNVILLKGLCVAITGFGMPFSAAIAQYANTGEWPSRIVWLSILIGSAIGGANAIYAWLSGSFTAYKETKNGSGVTDNPQPSKPNE